MSQDDVIALKSTGAIGDLVIASAIPGPLNQQGYHTAIISKAFTLPLWQGLQNTSTFETEDSIPENATLVDISDYLAGMPHSNNLPLEFIGSEEARKGHLCEWMAYSIFDKTRIHVQPDRYNVRIILEPKEVAFGKEKVHKVSKEHGNLPVIIIAPYSNSKNRNIPKDTLEHVVRGLSGFAVPCLLEPYGDDQYIERTTPIGDRSLRNASAILYASAAYIGVDSGPLHMINGALQGTPAELRGDININGSKVILVVGSSAPEVVSYANNHIIQATSGCSIAPCGAHGYWPLAEYGQRFNVVFYESGLPKDTSGCKFNDYQQLGIAPCMEEISPDEIIETVRSVLK